MRHSFYLPRSLGDPALCLGAYLYGSLPFVYLLGHARGVDLRRHGSGNVGGGNLWAAAGPWRGVIGWLFDASKGALPVLVGRWLRRSAPASEVAGACGLAGQCWPLFPRFAGGRGISAFVGVAAAIDPLAASAALTGLAGGSLWRVAPMLGGHRLGERIRASRSKSVPLGCLLGVLAFPAVRAAHAWPRDPVSPAPLLVAALIVGRRLTAPLPDDHSQGPARRPSALLYRLLYDRNTAC